MRRNERTSSSTFSGYPVLLSSDLWLQSYSLVNSSTFEQKSWICCSMMRPATSLIWESVKIPEVLFIFFSELKNFQNFLLKSGGFHTVSSALKSWDCEILSFSHVFHHFIMRASELQVDFRKSPEIYPGFQMLPS